MAFESWLCIDGTEVINNQRTLTYLRQCDCGSWEIAPSGVATSLDDPAGLECFCAATAEPSYLSPADDPAPWFNASRPESADFLGFLAEVEVTSVLRRSATELVGGGAVVGALTPRPRVVNVVGLAVASSEAGMAYGERWLNEVLAARHADCCGSVLDMLPFCDPSAFRQVLKAGVTDAPTFVPDEGSTPDCLVSNVAWQMTGGVPYLLSRGEAEMNEVLSPAEQACALVSTPQWPSDLVLKIEVSAATDTGPVVVTFTPTAGLVCPDTDRSPYSTITIPEIAAGSRVIIDGRTEEVEVYDVVSRTIRPGLNAITFEGGLRWPALGPCASACVCVENDAGAADDVTVEITSYMREI